MKIIKLIKDQTELSEEAVDQFLRKNLPDGLLQGLFHDDPKIIDKVLKSLGLATRKDLKAAAANALHKDDNGEEVASGAA